jgi:hypothetical protein
MAKSKQWVLQIPGEESVLRKRIAAAFSAVVSDLRTEKWS